MHLCEGGYGTVVGVDYQWDHPKEVDFIKERHDRFKFVLGDSIESAEQVHKDYGKVDILFIDTDHTYQRTMNEFNAWKPFLSPKAVVCFDDILRHHPNDLKSMEDAWDDVKGQKIRLDHLHDGSYPHGGGFGVYVHR